MQFQIQKPAVEDDIILYGNYQRLLQVILNLTGNAIKFTGEGGIRISAEVIKKKDDCSQPAVPRNGKNASR